LSDSFGRRPVILISLAVYIAASVGAAMAPSFGVLLACRVLQGLAAGAGSVISRAIVQDRFKGGEAQKILSHIMMVFGLAPAIAPILGGALQVAFGWRSIFWFLAAFGILMFVVVYRLLPESLPRRHPFQIGPIAANYWKVLRHRQFLLLSIAIGTSFGGFALYIGSAAYFIIDILHLPETAFGWLFIPLISGMMIGSALAGKFAHRYPQATLVWTGYGLMLVAALVNIGYNLFFAAEVPWAVLPLFLYSFALSIAMPPMTLIALNHFPDNSGLASSMQSFIQMLLFALVSGVVAPLLFDSAFKLACGVMAGLLLSALCWIWVRSGARAA
jgi:DHA1 family bicyclomycin/chloramphenicol resistance-like MFS transporter